MKRARDLARQRRKEEKKQAKKKQKADGASPPPDGSPLDADIFSPARVAELRGRYQAAQPFPHVVIDGLCQDARARAIEHEARTGLRADFKETDLFKVYQTPDLANLAASEEEAAVEDEDDDDDDDDD
jgi:hypothetical protein